MQWQPSPGKQLLSPFSHQVAGQSSMLWYDSTTVCKPLITREHYVYQTLPLELTEFTPEYRGEIEVQLQEDNGYIQLYGVPVNLTHSSNNCPCFCNIEHEQYRNRTADVISDGQFDHTNLTNDVRNSPCAVRVLRSGSYEVCADTDEKFSINSEQTSTTQGLNPWSLKSHKRLLDKMRKSEHSHNSVRFILLKNVVAGFDHPCILDLKIGSRLHGDDASSKKVSSQSMKCKETTSSTLGVRLCGMQVYQADSGVFKNYDKFYGRLLTHLTFKEMLYEFLHNGKEFRSELLQPVIERLSQLISCLQTMSSYRFYASSLLVIYDGNVSAKNETFVKQRHPDNGHVSVSSVHPNSFDSISSVVSTPSCNGETDAKSSLLHNCLSTSTCISSQCASRQSHDHTHTPGISSEHSSSHKPHPGHINTSSLPQHHSHPPLVNHHHQVTSPCEARQTRNIPKSLQHISCVESVKTVNYSNGSSHTDSSDMAISSVTDEDSFVVDSSIQVQEDPSKSSVNKDSIPSHVPQHSTVCVTSGSPYQPSNGGSNSYTNKTTHNGYPHVYQSITHQTQQDITPSDHLKLISSSAKNNKDITVEECFSPTMCSTLEADDKVTKENMKMDVRMIDFAHTTHRGFVQDRLQHTGPDEDYINGLRNLVRLFQELQDEHSLL